MLSDSQFILFKNLFSILARESIRYKYKDGLVEVQDNENIWCTHRYRSHLYSQGLALRGLSLGKTYFLSQIDFLNGDYVIDCGANMGDLQLYFWTNKIGIQYIGIEPNPVDYACLKNNADLHAVTLNIGLWNVDSTLTFYIDSVSASSSLIEPLRYSEKINIKAARLDSLDLPSRIKLFKVEGEGAEPEILFGSTGILDRIEYISVDVGPERGINELSTRDEVVEFLNSKNFKIVNESVGHRKVVLFKNKNFE